MLQRTHCAVFLLAAGLAPLYAGKPGGGCQDTPTQWTLNDYYIGTTLNAIRGDSAGAYVNGAAGVSALIKICDVNGTNNAVLMTGSSRTLTFDFGGHLLASNNTHDWALKSVIGSGGVLNVRDLTFVPAGKGPSLEYDFTTWVGADLPVKGYWNFRMFKPTTDAISGDLNTNPYVASVNSPYIDSPVNVHHCPANSSATTGPCVGVIHETWLISPDAGPTTYTDGSPAPPSAVWVGGLVNTQKSTSPVSAGQFSMPFRFTISLLQ